MPALHTLRADLLLETFSKDSTFSCFLLVRPPFFAIFGSIVLPFYYDVRSELS